MITRNYPSDTNEKYKIEENHQETPRTEETKELKILLVPKSIYTAVW